MTIHDSNNPYANVYNLKPIQPSYAQKSQAAEIQDAVFQTNESYKDGMREFRFIDSQTTASKSADEALAMAQSQIKRTTDIIKARFVANMNDVKE
jgi:hypothetical protein